MSISLFLVGSLVIGYTCVIFPVLLFARAKLFPRTFQSGESTPTLTVIVAAYEEAANIESKIKNLLEQDYPRERLEIVIASDGSQDETVSIASQFAESGVIVLDLPRKGKGHAINAGVAVASGDILVLTDANVVFATDALRQLVAPLADGTVGGVVGNQVYERGEGESPTADGERAYWGCDRQLKEWQSRAGSVTSATGSIYAIRRELFEPVPASVMDDFFVSTGVVWHGYRLVMAKAAVAYEQVAVAPGVEFSRKLRIVGQGMRAVAARRGLLNPFRFGFYSVQLFTHKVLRRCLLLPLLVILPSSLILGTQYAFFSAVASLQLCFYGLAILGWALRRTAWMRFKILSLPYFVCMTNVAALIAIARIVCGGTIDNWEPERHMSSTVVEPQ